MEAFKALDRDQTQFIDPKNLVIAFSTLGEDKKLDQVECRKIINLVAKDQLNRLNYDEFITLMTMQPDSDSELSEDDEEFYKDDDEGLNLGGD